MKVNPNSGEACRVWQNDATGLVGWCGMWTIPYKRLDLVDLRVVLCIIKYVDITFCSY